MKKNISFVQIDKKSCFISKDAKIGKNTKISPFVVIKANVEIGENCEIDSFTKLENTKIGNNTKIISSDIADSKIGNNVTIGPYSRIRKNTIVCDESRIGNYVELKNARIGKKTKSAHHSYIGDAILGENVNVGCGVIFANYDGKDKFQTLVGNNVFIGSNSNLVAPINLGDNSFIAAGTTITKDLEEKEFAIGRVRQETKKNYLNKYTDGILKENEEMSTDGNVFFGTDGIRGEVGKEITNEISIAVAKSLSRIQNSPKIVIGRDTRKSGPELLNSFLSGLSDTSKTYDLGIATTPAVAYMTEALSADFGVVFTASHNPSTHNGIKIFSSDGKKLSLETEKKIDKMMKLLIDEPVQKTKINKPVEQPLDEYISFLKSQSSSLKGIKIALDFANGASCKIAKDVFIASGAELYLLGDAEGEINDGVGCLYPDKLSRAVSEHSCDIGFSFDGDADRIIACDEKGNLVDGDKILFCLAKEYKRKNKLKNNKIVATIQSNLALKTELKKEGIETIITPVGDKFVISEMEKNDISLGGEQSGHIITREVMGSGDGVLIAIILSSLVAREKASLSSLTNLKLFPQRQKSFPCISKEKILSDVDIKNQISNFEKELDLTGRIVLRGSGTEMKVRLLVESEDEKKCEEIFSSLSALVSKKVCMQSVSCGIR